MQRTGENNLFAEKELLKGMNETFKMTFGESQATGVRWVSDNDGAVITFPYYDQC